MKIRFYFNKLAALVKQWTLLSVEEIIYVKGGSAGVKCWGFHNKVSRRGTWTRDGWSPTYYIRSSLRQECQRDAIRRPVAAQRHVRFRFPPKIRVLEAGSRHADQWVTTPLGCTFSWLPGQHSFRYLSTLTQRSAAPVNLYFCYDRNRRYLSTPVPFPSFVIDRRESVLYYTS